MMKEKEDLENKKIILVNENDEQIGVEEKMKTHRDGLLHRCFSILVFNSKEELLLQKRADGKYHCGGLWTNSCCGHPEPNEEINEAAHRRLQEEMGFDCGLKEKFVFHYRAEFDNGLIENEIDHVFVGKYDKEVVPNAKEVGDFKFMGLEDIKKDIIINPNIYTPWFKIIITEHWGRTDH